MLIFFEKFRHTEETIEVDFTSPTLEDELEKTHYALNLAYAGFNNATDFELIDAYIYEINSLIKRHNYLSKLAGINSIIIPESLDSESTIQSLTSHVFG